MFTEKQVKKLKLHSEEAVKWLENKCPDCPWLQYLGSLDLLCDTTIELFQSQKRKEITIKAKKVKIERYGDRRSFDYGVTIPDKRKKERRKNENKKG